MGLAGMEDRRGVKAPQGIKWEKRGPGCFMRARSGGNKRNTRPRQRHGMFTKGETPKGHGIGSGRQVDWRLLVGVPRYPHTFAGLFSPTGELLELGQSLVRIARLELLCKARWCCLYFMFSCTYMYIHRVEESPQFLCRIWKYNLYFPAGAFVYH